MCDLTPDQIVTLPNSELAPFEARSYVRQHACPEHATIAMDALSLITSELVTNAVRHGQPPIVLRLSCLTSQVRLSVSDTGPRLPREQGSRGAPGPRHRRQGRTGMGHHAPRPRQGGVVPYPHRDAAGKTRVRRPHAAGPAMTATSVDTKQAVHDLTARLVMEYAGAVPPGRVLAYVWRSESTDCAAAPTVALFRTSSRDPRVQLSHIS